MSISANPAVAATPASAAQISRVKVSQPPLASTATMHTPAVSAIAPPGSAPRYGLPTRTTPAPPIAATTGVRHRCVTCRTTTAVHSSSPATNTPSATVPSPAYWLPSRAEYPATPLSWSLAPVTRSTATTANAIAATTINGPVVLRHSGPARTSAVSTTSTLTVTA